MTIPIPLATLGSRFLTLLDAEKAHQATIHLLKKGARPHVRVKDDKRLHINVAGLEFANPLGLAAGFDKNAEVPDAMLTLGFGFVEVGAVTPRQQTGNDKPRVFRLRHNRAVINRYGFNNDGLEAIGKRLEKRASKPGIVGINLGANKDSEDRTEDYVTSLKRLEPHVSFCTVNISSPNTPGLRALQDRTALDDLLSRVAAARVTEKPLFLKVAPDLTDEDKADIVASAKQHGISGLIVSNTTITRAGVEAHPDAGEAGGLSGAPLFRLSTEVLRDFARELSGDLPLIGVGGIFSARDAYKKILSGASLVQLYTALIYQGPGLPSEIIRKLPEFLEADGFSSVGEAVGADVK
ncbi:quinone-dependent dihydroorotate dehydrogenase [Parvularcula sp. IMCC14364]|uniref:quinone-dependent dihydroorotate dehydrogenase n=1 Tax=Parvularcula sp. IMCC14364 TaxID=3067902 RepID=UPI00274052D7|nr:quinone-dependent dihydroorotate dehydrogenase [Parvularcula sp. IMCC14364]